MSEFKGTKGRVQSGEVYYRRDVGTVTVIESVDGDEICEVYGSIDQEPLANIALIAEAFNTLHTTGRTPRELAERVQELEAELSAVRDHVRPLSDKAELADTYEAWLLDIGRQVGCQHLDEQLPNCVISTLQGDRDQEELAALRKETAWIRQKLDLPEDCPFLSGQGRTLAGAMHVICSDAHGFREYIKAHKCDDKQGEIARLSVDKRELTARSADLERQVARLVEERDELVDAIKHGIHTIKSLESDLNRHHPGTYSGAGKLESVLAAHQPATSTSEPN